MEKFTGKKRILLVPASWLNTVANILSNISSPKHTVSVKIEGVGEGANLIIDIIPDAAAREMRSVLSADFICRGAQNLLGDGLKWSERGLTIDKDWLQREIRQVDKA